MSSWKNRRKKATKKIGGGKTKRSLYQIFYDELLTKHGMTIFDSADWCKAEFRKRGLDESEFETRLFFRLLDKNVSLEMRKTTHLRNDFTNHQFALTIYAKMFGSEKLPNEYESILIRHIDGLVELLSYKRLLSFEYSAPNSAERASDVKKGADEIVRRYGTAMLESPRKMKSALHDVCDGFLQKEIEQFCAFLERLNKGETLFREAEGLAFLKTLDAILESQSLSYPPLTKQGEAFAAQRRKRKPLEEKNAEVKEQTKTAQQKTQKEKQARKEKEEEQGDAAMVFGWIFLVVFVMLMAWLGFFN